MKEPYNTKWFMSLLMDLEVKPRFTELSVSIRTQLKGGLRAAFFAWLEDRSELTYATLLAQWDLLFEDSLEMILYAGDGQTITTKGVGVIHQICAYSLKTDYETTTEQKEEALRGFLLRNDECGRWRRQDCEVLRRARSLCCYVLKDLDLSHSAISHDFHDGPGAVLEKDPVERKSHLSHWFNQLDCQYPIDTFWWNVNAFLDLNWWRNSEAPGWKARSRYLARADVAKLPDLPGFDPERVEASELGWSHDVAVRTQVRWATSQLTVVPKDCSGPRLVFTHPTVIMRAQKAQGIALAKEIQNKVDRIKFTDQTVNGHTAVEASYSKEFATLDLSDASDRIPLSLLAYLLPRRIWLALMSTRTHYVTAERQTYKLHMFAPMGNATCFPVQTLVFWAIATAATSVAFGDRYDWRPRDRVAWFHRHSAFVFGDDLIVPSQAYSTVVTNLQLSNLKVSKTKSFVNGNFRESCGYDAFNGTVITPLRQKVNADMCGTEANVFAKLVSFHNRIQYQYPTYRRLLSDVRNLILERWRHVGFTTNHVRNPSALLTDADRVQALNRGLKWGYDGLHRDTVLSLSTAIKSHKVAVPDWCGLNDWFFKKLGTEFVEIVYREDELCFRLVWANLFDAPHGDIPGFTARVQVS